MQRIDLSHVVEDGMITYKGLPAPGVCDFLTHEASRDRYAPGTEFHIGTVELCANTGTYVDSPFHRYRDGIDLAELPLERLADLDAVVVDSSERALDRSGLEGHDVAGRAVLARTGWDRHWRTDAYFEGHPFLTGDAARHLVADRNAEIHRTPRRLRNGRRRSPAPTASRSARAPARAPARRPASARGAGCAGRR